MLETCSATEKDNARRLVNSELGYIRLRSEIETIARDSETSYIFAVYG